MRGVRQPEVSGRARELGGSGVPLCWEELTSPEIADLVERVNAAIIPFGAIEQHGPHMPLCVDWNIAYHVALGVSALTGVPVLHPVTYGVSGSHGDFPGTVGLRAETFLAVVDDLVDWLYRSGIRQFVLLNGHAWNGAPLQVCADKIRTRYDDVRVRALDYVDEYPPTEIDGRYEHGRLLAHANYFETSCMLYVSPDLVRMDRAVAKEDWPSFWDYRADQVTASGVWGRDVPEASRENGEREITRCIETMARAIAAGRDEKWPRSE
jgi:creatinine amidohydrolase